MHNKIPQIFTFIDSFEEKKILKLGSNIGIIYRNYNKKIDLNTILKIKKICKRNNKKFYLANNIHLSVKYKLDGAYIPSFNKSLHIKKYCFEKKFLVIGSAHNLKEIKIKEKQGIKLIFLSPLFQTKNYKKKLGIIKFNLLSLRTKCKIIALGGIDKNNLKQLKMTNAYGFSGIRYFN